MKIRKGGMVRRSTAQQVTTAVHLSSALTRSGIQLLGHSRGIPVSEEQLLEEKGQV